MLNLSRVYLDTNVYISAIQGKDKELSEALNYFLFRTRARVPTLMATCELTFAETFVQPYRDGNERLIRIYENLSYSNNSIEIGPIDRKVLYYAAVLRARYQSLKLPDAIHLSSAFGHGCTHFLSGDMRLADQYTLTNHRFGIARGPLELKVIRPTLSSINALIEATG